MVISMCNFNYMQYTEQALYGFFILCSTFQNDLQSSFSAFSSSVVCSDAEKKPRF